MDIRLITRLIKRSDLVFPIKHLCVILRSFKTFIIFANRHRKPRRLDGSTVPWAYYLVILTHFIFIAPFNDYFQKTVLSFFIGQSVYCDVQELLPHERVSCNEMFLRVNDIDCIAFSALNY